MRLSFDKTIDVRLFFFNGSKLIFCSRDANSFYEEWKRKLGENFILKSIIKDKSWVLSDLSKVILLNLLPISITVSHGINRFSSASVSFISNRRRFYKRNKGEQVETYWSTWDEESLFEDGKDMDIAIDTLRSNLKELENNEYYRKLIHYFEEGCSDLGFTKYTRPFPVLDYGILVFIEALDRDGVWRNIFTGYVISISETYTAASERRFTLNCVSIGNYFNKVPIYPELGSGLFTEYILPKELRPFLLAYYAQYRKTDFWKSSYIGKSLKELMEFLIKELRYRMGTLTEEELEKCLDEFRLGGMRPLKEEEKKEAKMVYMNYLKDDYALIFPLFKEEVKVYRGQSNKRESFYLDEKGIASIFIPAEFDFREGGEGKSLYESIYGERIKNLDIFRSPDEIFEVFQRLIGLAITQSRFHPTEKRMTELFNAVIKQFPLVYFEDGLGNIIFDFIRYNEIPGSEYAFYEDLRKEEGKRYILKEEKDIISYTLSKEGDKLLTAFFLHAKFNIPNARVSDIIMEEMTTGHAWHSPWHLLRFGYNVEAVQDIYFNFQLSFPKEIELVREIFSKYARAYLEMRNAFMTKKLKVTMKHRPDLLVGRTVYIPSLEKLYYIIGISHTISPGSDFTTSLELACGHDIDYRLKEPRVVLLKDFKDIRKVITATDGLVEGTYTTSCNIVRINREYFPANIKNGVMVACPYPSMSIEEVLREHNKSLPEYVKVLENKKLEYIDIDVRLLKFIDWFFVTFTNFFNDKKVLDYDSLEFREVPEVLVFPYISDIWRLKQEGKKSRHFEGRAVDISGLTFLVLTYKGLLKVLSKLLEAGGVSKILTTKTVLDPLKIRSNLGTIFIETNTVRDAVEMKIKDFRDLLSNWKYKMRVSGKDKVVMMRLDIFKDWWDEYCRKTIRLLGKSKSADNLANLCYLIDKYIGRENIGWITNYNPDVKVDIELVDKILRDEGVLTEEERKAVMAAQYDEFLKGGVTLDKFIEENKDILSNIVIKQGSFSDIITNTYVKKMLDTERKEVYRRILVALAPENCILQLTFHFNGLPEEGELVKFRNRVSDIITASILLWKNQLYFKEVGIGLFEDATGGIRRCLKENKHLYVDVSEDIRGIVDELAGDEEGTNGWEKEGTKNYIIWKGGEGKSYEEIRKEKIGLIGDLDYYHLFHIHVSVGQPDCGKIEVLKNTYRRLVGQ